MPILLLALLAADAPLVVATKGEVSLSHAQLTARSDLREITVQVPGVAAPSRLEALPLRDLVEGLPEGTDDLDVACADGFVAVLPLASVQNRAAGNPMAYLAVETARNPFPSIKGQATGPYMVVWATPVGQTVPRELWPYQVTRLSGSVPLEKRYPRLTPASQAARAGLKVFVQNCLPCHSLNGEGPAHVGPDLNVPHSPMEYFGPERLRAYVRDPQSLHAWANARMPPFPRSVLGDSELEELLVYLGDRSTHR